MPVVPVAGWGRAAGEEDGDGGREGEGEGEMAAGWRRCRTYPLPAGGGGELLAGCGVGAAGWLFYVGIDKLVEQVI